MRFYQEMLVELMDHLDIRKAHLSALSAGCCAAMLCAINHPERVSSLIIQGPVGGLIPPWHPKAWLKMAILLIYLCTLSILALSVGKKRTAELVNKVPAQTRDYVPLLPELECKISPFAKFFLTMEIAHPPYIGKLECIKTPTLVIYGEEDPFPRRYFEYVYDHISGIKRLQLIPKGRHVVMVDKPQEFNEACQAFLGFVESLQQA